MPFAASITTRNGLIASISTNESTRSTQAGQMSYGSTIPRAALAPLPLIFTARSRISSNPDSPPTGSAPRRTIFMPV